MKKHITASNA